MSEFPAAIPAVIIALLTLVHVWPLDRRRAIRVLVALTLAALAAASVLMLYQYACFGSPFHLAYSSEHEYVGMEQGIYGVNLPRWIRLRRILFGDYRGLLPLAPALAVAPIGFVFIRRRLAAAAAFAIAGYYILLNASYAYWEGGWSYGPRHASPAIPFLCIGLAALWTVLPPYLSRVGRACLGLLAAYGVAVTLVAVSTMPLPPNNIRRPVAELLWPAFRDGDLALNTQTFVSGGANPDFRAHEEPKAAFNLGMKIGLTGLASLLPLLLAWAACGYAVCVPSRTR